MKFPEEFPHRWRNPYWILQKTTKNHDQMWFNPSSTFDSQLVVVKMFFFHRGGRQSAPDDLKTFYLPGGTRGRWSPLDDITKDSEETTCDIV